jgi:hypothetical protein
MKLRNVAASDPRRAVGEVARSAVTIASKLTPALAF